LFFIVAPLFFEKIIQRAFKLGDALLDKMEINDRGLYGGMSQESFNGIYIGTVGQQVGGKGMS
jgi:hypothetical protein